jgi:putative membrane protein insertion efficiency factor
MRKSLSAMTKRCLVALAILLIRVYKLVLAPLWIGGGCRHFPSCSDYAIVALQHKGIKEGTVMALKRIWRCRPGGTYGYDPVEHAN